MATDRHPPPPRAVGQGAIDTESAAPHSFGMADHPSRYAATLNDGANQQSGGPMRPIVCRLLTPQVGVPGAAGCDYRLNLLPLTVLTPGPAGRVGSVTSRRQNRRAGASGSLTSYFVQRADSAPERFFPIGRYFLLRRCQRNTARADFGVQEIF